MGFCPTSKYLIGGYNFEYYAKAAHTDQLMKMTFVFNVATAW